MAKHTGQIRVGVGGVIVNQADEVLLLLRGRTPEAGHWSVPGGSVQFGEKVEEALKREIREELGVEVAVAELLAVVDHILIAHDTHFVSPQFLVEIVAGKPRNLEPTSHLEMKWFPVRELPARMTVPSRVAMEKYLGSLVESGVDPTVVL